MHLLLILGDVNRATVKRNDGTTAYMDAHFMEVKYNKVYF